ncbi:MAG TPA: tetratricopeptide repeat protein [Anaerolineales bacterium]|nr:tetratricopeptide repeat protein [Anaerolineales bacterium]
MSEHEVWNELGNLYFLSGSYPKAVKAYKRAIELKPEIGEPCSNLALTYAQMGKYAEAAEFYQRSISLLKDEVDKAVSLHKLGDIYFHLKQFPQASEAYQQTEKLIAGFSQIVEASDPLDLLLHCQHSDTHQYRQQVDLVDNAHPDLFLDSEEPPLTDDLTAWWFDGQIENQEIDGFAHDFEYVDEEGLHYVSNNVVYTKPLKWEVETFDHSQLTDHNADALSPAGIKNTATVLDLIPDDKNISQDMSAFSNQTRTETDIQPEMQEQQLAMEDTLVAADLSPTAVIVAADESEVVTDTPEFSAQDMTDVDAIQYDTPLDLQAVDLSEDELLEIQVDIARFKQALETNPRNAYAWDVLGGHYKTLGLYDDAIDAYQKAVSVDSTQAFYFHHLALVFSAVGRHDDAIHAYERVIDLDPNHGLAHATLGGYYRKNGNDELAKVHIEKAMGLLDKDENEYNRACMESICGNADHSLELLEIALKNKQTYVNWARKDPDFDFIRDDPRFQMLLAEYAVKQV